MSIKNIGLIVFALVALAAVFSFIFVLGGAKSTGAAAASQLYGVSPAFKDARDACATLSPCPNKVPGVPIGFYDSAGNWLGPGKAKEEADKLKLGISQFKGNLYVCTCLGAQPGGFPGGYYDMVYLRSPYYY